MEYESEEFETREVEKDVEEEVAIPQVKTLYRYQGQGMGFAKGELFILVSKKNKDWWAVRYVSYMQEKNTSTEFGSKDEDG